MSQGLNSKSRDNLSALEPSDPGPMYVEDVLNSYFHSPDLYRGTVNSSCLRKSPSATCFSGTRKRTECPGTRTKHFACCLGARTRFLNQRLCKRTGSFARCLGAKAKFLIRCLGTRTSSRVASAWRLSRDCGVTRCRSSLAFSSNLGTCAWLSRSCSGLFDE